MHAQHQSSSTSIANLILNSRCVCMIYNPMLIRSAGIATEHHTSVDVDCTRAYHFGARYVVEMEIVLPATMLVCESHDIALALQHKLEALEDVERAHVHVDYEKRTLPEHKVERKLLRASEGSPLLVRGTSGKMEPIFSPTRGVDSV